MPSRKELLEGVLLNRHLDSAKPADANKLSFLSREDLERCSQAWLFEGEFRAHSPKTTETRRLFAKNLLWFLEQNGYPSCDKHELKAFFVYLGKPTPEGRYGGLH